MTHAFFWGRRVGLVPSGLRCELSVNGVFLVLLDFYQLEQIITEPTRVTIDTTSLIDVFITNIFQKVKSSGVIRLGISDHYMIYVCTKDAILSRPPPKIVENC
jgi:hypothetical protein